MASSLSLVLHSRESAVVEVLVVPIETRSFTIERETVRMRLYCNVAEQGRMKAKTFVVYRDPWQVGVPFSLKTPPSSLLQRGISCCLVWLASAKQRSRRRFPRTFF